MSQAQNAAQKAAAKKAAAEAEAAKQAEAEAAAAAAAEAGNEPPAKPLDEEAEANESADLSDKPKRNAGNAAYTGVIVRLEKAPIGSKIIVNIGVSHFAGPDGAEEIPAGDPARRLLPAGSWIRRVAEKEFSGFVPGGARRSTTDHFAVTAKTAQQVLHDLVASL